MPVIQQTQPKRSISQNRNSRFRTSLLPAQDSYDLYSQKMESEQHEQILRQRARRFVARMRKQRQYVGGKNILKKQIEEKKRVQEQKLMQALMHEKQEMQKSIKMTIALEKILVNQCKKEKKMIKELSEQLKTANHESSDQESKLSRYQEQRRSYERQTPSSKRFKTFDSQPTNPKQQSPQISYLPPIANPTLPRPVDNNIFKYYKPGRPINKPKQEKQIYLNKLDQMKLKSIESKIKKLSKLYNQILDNKS